MQIGTGYFFESRTRQMTALSSRAAQLQQQIATGKRIEKPSDDPVAAAQIARLGVVEGDQAQYARNITVAQALLGASETALTALSTNIQRAQELAIRASSEVLNDSNRAAIAAELHALLDDMVGVANARDVRGTPLFGGAGTGLPFTRQPDGAVSFEAAGEAPPVPIGRDVAIQASDSGTRLFGGLVVGGSETDIFAIVGDLAAALAPGGSADADARRAALARATEGLAKADERLTTARTSIGARAARLDLETERLASAKIDNALTRGDIEGTDVQATVIELQKTMLALEATQASFTRLSQLSLFDYIR